MLSTEDAAIERKIQRIGTIKAGFRQTKDRHYALESVLRDYYEHLRTVQSSTQEDIARSLNALHQALNEPELVEQQLLINFISEIVRFVENVGLGFAFSKAFMDRAIEVYRKAGFSPINLYLEKASLLRLDQLESVEREQALLEARSCAQAANDMESLIRVLFACAAYYTEVSQYQKSLQLCHECERLIESNAHLSKYMAKLFTYFGMNYTPLFQYQLAKDYLIRAKELLAATLASPDEELKDDFWISTMETVHHYLGRIAQAEGNTQEAMQYFVEGYRYLSMFHEESLARKAFYHLRFGELLTSVSLLEQARDHLRIGQDFFDRIQFSSSGRLQVSLAWAALCNKEGNYINARDYLLTAREEARRKHFPRGELWCLVNLFWLELGHFHLYRAAYVFIQALSTWRDGELRRSGGFRLVGKYFLQVVSTPFKLIRRAPHTVMGGGTFNASLSTCICPIHRQNKAV